MFGCLYLFVDLCGMFFHIKFYTRVVRPDSSLCVLECTGLVDCGCVLPLAVLLDVWPDRVQSSAD